MTRVRFVRLALFAALVPAVLPTAGSKAGGQSQPAPTKAHAALVHSIAVSPDGKTVATAGFDNVIKIWDLAADGTLKEKKELKGHTGPVYAVAFHPKNPVLVSGSQDKTARVWDVSTGKQLRQLPEGRGDIYGLAFSPDSKWLACVASDDTVRVHDAATGKERVSGPCPVSRGRPARVDVAFTAGGKRLAIQGGGPLLF